jgi:hypothetical protein
LLKKFKIKKFYDERKCFILIHEKICKLKVIVSGTGRSGTVYMARALSNLGYMCGHESIFTDGGYDKAIELLNNRNLITTSKVDVDSEDCIFDSTLQVAESSYMSAPYLDKPIINNTKIIHVTRNPLLVLSSTFIDANFFDDANPIQMIYRNFVYSHLGELKKINNLLERSAAYYVWWNNMVEFNCNHKNYLRIQVENIEKEEFFNFLNVPITSFDKIDKKINSWKIRDRNIMISDIPEGTIRKEFIDIIERYGY